MIADFFISIINDLVASIFLMIQSRQSNKFRHDYLEKCYSATLRENNVSRPVVL